MNRVKMSFKLNRFEVCSDILSLLGEGTFGQVLPGQDTSTGAQVAVKKLRASGMDHRWLTKEVEAYKQIAHHNIVQLQYAEIQDGFLWMVLEFCPWNLDTYCASQDPVLEERVELMRQCGLAINYLHTLVPQAIIHRDIKPANILVKIHKQLPIIKVCDFGLSRILTVPEGMNTVCGSPQYMAPELLRCGVKLTYDASVDIFALGVLCYGLLQFNAENGLTVLEKCGDWSLPLGRCINQYLEQDLPVWCPVRPCIHDTATVTKLKVLLAAMLHHQPECRPTSGQVNAVLHEVAASMAPTHCNESDLSSSSDDVPMSPESWPPASPNSRVDLTVIQAEHLKSLSFDGEVWVGFGYQGECLVAARTQSRFAKATSSLTHYKLTRAPNTFQHLWRKPLPGDTGIKCCKFVTKSGNIILHERGVTTLYDPNLRRIKCHGVVTNDNNGRVQFCLENRMCGIHLDSWYLCDSLTGLVSVKSVESGELSHMIRLQRGHREDFKSIVCCNPSNGYTAVACAEMNFLEIFNTDGASLLTRSLGYSPCQMSCSESHILVAEWDPPCLHLHNWEGDELGWINSNQLGLSHKERICRLSPVWDGMVMIAVWCRRKDRDRIMAFKIYMGTTI